MPPQELKLKAVVGFSGKVEHGLSYSPCGRYVVYPLGSFVVIKNIRSGKEAFLDLHDREVSCIAVSHDGRRIASGQVQQHGVKANAIIWNFELAKTLLDNGNTMIGDRCVLHVLRQHVGKVQSVDFSCSSQHLSTLGGQDDNNLVIWNVETGIPICGYPASSESALVAKWLNNRGDRLVTLGYYHIRVWQVDFNAPKLHPIDVKMGSLRRIFTSIAIAGDDSVAYCGTSTGDLVKVKIERDDSLSFNDPEKVIPNLLGVSKDRISLGLNVVLCLMNPATGNYNLVVGGGDGTVAYMNPSLGLVKNYVNELKGGITSIAEHPTNGKLLIGTSQCNRYEVSRNLLDAELIDSCHYGPVRDVSFPEGCPDLIITSSVGDIRVWNIVKKQELLRIQVPNLDCLSSIVTPSGSLILSGWEDGRIRAFLPESGKLKFTINDAHDKVTALAVIDRDNNGNSPWRIVSGGSDGKVRVWSITPQHQVLVSSLKEHRAPINCIRVSPDRSQCISASADGSCIVWDLSKYVRLTALFETNMFQSVVYHPDQSQIMTCGSSHKITYWDAVDGQAIRVIDGGEGVMTSLDIEPLNGDYIVSGCEDKLVKVWHYDEGEVLAVGRGHSGIIKSAKISPNRKNIVSVGSTGEILLWELPPLSDMFVPHK